MHFTGERQVSSLITGIRRDHVARYEFAIDWLNQHKMQGCRVLDCACGVGYGSFIMANAGFDVVGVDNSMSAIQYANTYWKHENNKFRKKDAYDLDKEDETFDVIVSFESLEHFEFVSQVIDNFSKLAPVLIFSVPNEAVIPFGPGFAFHYRHYRSDELFDLIKPYELIDIRGQLDKQSPVSIGIEGRTLVGVGKIF